MFLLTLSAKSAERYILGLSYSSPPRVRVYIINPRRVRSEGYSTWFVILSVCLSVCLSERSGSDCIFSPN